MHFRKLVQNYMCLYSTIQVEYLEKKKKKLFQWCIVHKNDGANSKKLRSGNISFLRQTVVF